MKEVTAHTPQEVLQQDFFRAMEQADLGSLAKHLQEQEPSYFQELVDTFGPFTASDTEVYEFALERRKYWYSWMDEMRSLYAGTGDPEMWFQVCLDKLTMLFGDEGATLLNEYLSPGPKP